MPELSISVTQGRNEGGARAPSNIVTPVHMPNAVIKKMYKFDSLQTRKPSKGVLSKGEAPQNARPWAFARFAQ